MDRLTVMKTFVTVVDAGSFARAARTLSMSPSLVSRHIADLEQQLGVQLLSRNARAVNLTAAGERYLAVSEQVLQLIEEEERALRGLRDQEAGPLAIAAPKWIGSIDLGDAVAEFAVTHPSISVRLELGGMLEISGGVLDSIIQFVGNRFDIAFVANPNPIPVGTVKIRDVADLEFVICAAPGYLAREGEPSNPLELTRADLLVNTHERAWSIGDEEHLQHYKLPKIVFQANSYVNIQKAAVRGMGIALLPVHLATDDLQAGHLQVLLPDYQIPSRPLRALYSPSQHTSRKVTIFLDFIEQWFRSHPLRVRSPAGDPGERAADQEPKPTASSFA